MAARDVPTSYDHCWPAHIEPFQFVMWAICIFCVQTSLQYIPTPLMVSSLPILLSCHGAAVCVPPDPWARHTLGGRFPGAHIPPGTQVPAAAGHQEETRQVLETRSK